MTSIPAEITAEWICVRCGSTNRRLVPAGTTTAEDSCLQCHTLHNIEAEARPVRWRSWLAQK
jgi:hypothetical protein